VKAKQPLEQGLLLSVLEGNILTGQSAGDVAEGLTSRRTFIQSDWLSLVAGGQDFRILRHHADEFDRQEVDHRVRVEHLVATDELRSTRSAGLTA